MTEREYKFKVGDRVKVTNLAIREFNKDAIDPDFKDWLSKSHEITHVSTADGFHQRWPYYLDSKYWFGETEIELVPEPTFEQKEIDDIIAGYNDAEEVIRIKVTNQPNETKWLRISLSQLEDIREILG